MNKTNISVQADSSTENGKLTHTVIVQTIDSGAFACIASDYTVRRVNYTYVIENGKVKCADVKNQ